MIGALMFLAAGLVVAQRFRVFVLIPLSGLVIIASLAAALVAIGRSPARRSTHSSPWLACRRAMSLAS